MKKKPLKKRVLQFFEYLAVRSVLGLLALVPVVKRRKISIWLARKLAALLPKKVRIIRDNMTHAFPEKTVAEIEGLVQENIRNLGNFFADFVEVVRFGKKRSPADGIVSVPDSEGTRELFKEGGIVVLGHMGNWEWHGALISSWMPGKIHALARRQSNPWSDRLIRRMRGESGIVTVYTDEGFYRFKNVIEGKNILSILADQDAGKRGLFLPFMNRMASTFTGPALLVRATRCPVFFGTSWHENGKFYTHVEKMKLPDDRLLDEPQKWDREFTETWVRMLESFIRKYPEDYFWVHNRWKSRPVEK